MNYDDDSFTKNLFYTLAFIIYILVAIVVRVKGVVNMPLGLYIGLDIVILFVNAYTYLPLFSGYFIILKLLGRLTIGWGWIVVTIILDIIFGIMVPEIRNTDYTKYTYNK